MKRQSAGKNTDMRKRTDSEVSRLFGPLTQEEIEEIRQAYRDGCKGEVIIGLRGNKRVITMLVPAHSYCNSSGCDMVAMEDQLRELGCLRYIRLALHENDLSTE